MGKQWKQGPTLFSWAPKSLHLVTVAMKLKDTCSLEKHYDQLRQHIKKQRHYFANKGPSNQSYVFPVVMCGCESWTKKRAEHQRTDAFELRSWRGLLRVPWTVACQAPLAMGFSRQEYWSGLPSPSPGGLPNPGTASRSSALHADAFTFWAARGSP